jgi:hypothetical protein
MAMLGPIIRLANYMMCDALLSSTYARPIFVL